MNGLIKGKEVHFDDTYLHVKLDDGRIISTPIDWYEPLKKATLAELKNYKSTTSGRAGGLLWVN